MNKIKRSLALVLAVVLTVGALTVPALAADWPQFLGDPSAPGISNGAAAISGSSLKLRWEKNTGSTWSDVPGTPIVVGDYVYYYSSQYLRKLELATGREVAKAQVYGAPVNQFFINIAYGEGKIFVPCQTDNLDDNVEISGCFLRVFDANTLKQLYVTETLSSGQMQSPVMYHDGYFVTGVYGRNGVYAGFDAADEDPSIPDEIKKMKWTVKTDSQYGFSFNGATFVGNYCYFGCENKLYVVNYKSGETKSFDIGSEYSIRSSITFSKETGRLYVASNHLDGHAAVFSYTLGSNGMPAASSAKKWMSDTVGGGTQSTPVVYRGRLYLGGGGHTMGSNEPFHVLDAVTLKEIYSVPIMSKGSAGVSTAYAAADNQWKVYLYMIPFAPNSKDQSEMWIISDSQGQTRAEYEVVTGIGLSQYCSQSVIVASDGSLIWYNDAGRLYCYENTAKDAPAAQPEPSGSGYFKDTKNHWARENIAYLANRGLVHGIGNDLFDPEGIITRAQFAQILANMSGDNFASCRTDVFTDVTDQWFAPAVAWAVETEIVDTDQQIYQPEMPISREDMALMLYRYVRNVAKADLPVVNEPVDFTDAGQISQKAADAVKLMQQGGIINGIPDGDQLRFGPKQQATRAEASAMIARFYDGLKK